MLNTRSRHFPAVIVLDIISVHVEGKNLLILQKKKRKKKKRKARIGLWLKCGEMVIGSEYVGSGFDCFQVSKVFYALRVDTN